MLDAGIGGLQRQNGGVLKHELFLPGDRLVVLELHQVGSLFPDGESRRAQRHHAFDLVAEPVLLDFGKQAEQRLPMNLVGLQARAVLHEGIPDLYTVFAIQHHDADIDALHHRQQPVKLVEIQVFVHIQFIR
ncbi:hypothetical protein D3C71_1673760 [compost metagenome]